MASVYRSDGDPADGAARVSSDDGDGQIAVFMDDEEYHVFKKI